MRWLPLPEDGSVPPADRDAGGGRIPASETGCLQPRQCAAQVLHQWIQKSSAKPHVAPPSDPAPAAKRRHPTRLSNAGPSARDMPGSLPPTAPKTTNVAAQTITVAAALAPHAELAASGMALRLSDYSPDRPAQGARRDHSSSSPRPTFAGCA